MERPDHSRDKSTKIALGALDEYLEDILSEDEATQEWWRQELKAMADVLSRGEPLSSEQIARWREPGVPRSIMLTVLVAMLALIGWGVWQILS